MLCLHRNVSGENGNLCYVFAPVFMVFIHKCRDIPFPLHYASNILCTRLSKPHYWSYMWHLLRARVDATYKTSNMVYLIECTKCSKQYVGKTENPLHLRTNGHQSDYYRKLPDKPVAVHFNTMGHTFENLTVIVIKQLGSTPTERRKVRESYWIHTLQ